jgi:thioredoxin reductase
MASNEALPVAVIGAGPVGLAAAAHLIRRGLPVKVYEADSTVAANVRDWGHVRLFSPWEYNTDTAARALLRVHGWQEPPGDVMPTGSDLYEAYLKPLSEVPEMAAVIETDVTVKAITRQSADKVLSQGRETKPFVLAVSRGNGAIRRDLARVVIDASGTWTSQNPLGAGGILAEGEAENARHITYGIPDVLGRDRDAYSGRTVLVVGAGHSAANVLLNLAKLSERDPRTTIVWATRGENLMRVYGGGQADQLPARGELGSNLKAVVDRGHITLVSGFSATQVRKVGEQVIIAGETASGMRELGPVDRIVVATGQRPDLDLTRELRLDLDPWLESTKALGPLIDPNLHSCGSVPPHGHRELAHPEPGFYTVGIKSYGRAPTFLMLTGYEQVRSVVAAIAGDLAAADDTHLVLPETGVCSTNLTPNGVTAPSGCCGGLAPEPETACCKADAVAKATTGHGCGCGTTKAAEPTPAKVTERAGCC